MSDYTEEELKVKELKVEKNIPMRPRYPHNAFASIVKKMNVGDSVFCKDSRQVTGLTAAITRAGMSYQTRSEGEGRRVWRTK